MKLETINKTTIEMKNEYDYEKTCGGCPTIFDFKDVDGHNLYFHLRHGHWRLFDETSQEILATGDTDKHDGICDWDDALMMMQQSGVFFEFSE